MGDIKSREVSGGLLLLSLMYDYVPIVAEQELKSSAKDKSQPEIPPPEQRARQEKS